MPLEKELIECARTDQMARLKKLVKKGVDLCCCTDVTPPDFGYTYFLKISTPLHYAAANGHLDIIKYLLKLTTKDNEPIVQVDARDKVRTYEHCTA